MGDSGSHRGGHGRGRGRGRGGHGGQDQAIKNLERAAADIQDMLQKMKTSDKQDSSKGASPNKRKDNRGSKSLMDLSSQGSAQKGASHYPNPGRQGSPHAGHYHPRPPNRGAYHPGPPHQDHYHPRPPARYQGPRSQAPPYQCPPPPAHHYHGPPDQAPYYHGPPGQAPYYQGPPDQAPYHQGPPGQAPYHSRPNYEDNFAHHAPPPSYEESVHHYEKPRPPPKEKKPMGGGIAPKQGASKTVSALELVKALAVFEGQMADAEVISKVLESSSSEVEEVVKQHKDIFRYMKDGSKMIVELVPNLKLCPQYLSDSGCTVRNTCQALHLCKGFIVARCDQGPSCPFGHKVDTNHNSAVLSKMYLDLIKPQNVLNIIRKVCRANSPPKICHFYATKDGCKKQDTCHFLHICKDYVMNDGKCPNKDCSYNHQLTHKQCRNVLTQHGISTNESIRDILLWVKAYLEKLPRTESSAAPSQGTKNQEESEEESEDSSDSDVSQKSFEASVRKKKTKIHDKNKASKAGGKNKEKTPTIKSTDFYGDVEIPEICIYAVNNKCANEKKGCKYLHAKSLFHWQVEKKRKWYNFRIFQSKTLENAYRDVSKSGVRLPPIDVQKLGNEDKNILELLGPNDWTANFKQMCIVDPTNNQLNIRRVSTPSSVASSLPQATVYEWSFVDENGKWIHYGLVDSLGKQDLISNVTSEDIEKQYVADPSSSFLISNARYKYIIDFKSMTQTNQSSKKVREVRRRPTRLSYQKTTATSNSTLPSQWKAMAPNQTHILVTLDPNQEEFQEVSKNIKLMIPTAKIIEVRRLQNQYLWHLFQYKKGDLSNRYDESTMNIQRLYHGTAADSIDSICKENIDGRRYDNKKDKYGKGTYFSNSSAIARTYCTPDAQGHLFVILAKVIIGYVVLGNKNHNKPPQNDFTGLPYDTTVDSMTAPTIFVKYDKEDYYPEYIVEMAA